jgi:ATP-dependent DNA ligase
VYAGKVGTGFDDRLLADLGRKLRARERRAAPFDRGPVPRRDVHWVEPVLVGQVGFSEWTRDGQLRHPRFLGLREDKAARDVVRERPSG